MQFVFRPHADDRIGAGEVHHHQGVAKNVSLRTQDDVLRLGIKKAQKRSQGQQKSTQNIDPWSGYFCESLVLFHHGGGADKTVRNPRWLAPKSSSWGCLAPER